MNHENWNGPGEHRPELLVYNELDQDSFHSGMSEQFRPLQIYNAQLYFSNFSKLFI